MTTPFVVINADDYYGKEGFREIHDYLVKGGHSCYDNRTVGKKDQVSFVVTHIDEERNVALGIITRIIKQTI